MKNPALIMLFLLSFSPPEEGKYRWDYKVLIDTAGIRVFETNAIRTSVQQLDKIKRPDKAHLKNRRAEAEKRKVIVSAYIVARGREEDGDYHLVLKDIMTDDSLIAEIPDPLMPKLRGFPALRKSYQQARNYIDSVIRRPPGRITDLDSNYKVTVTGILFFDKMAHGKGHAPNGIEIHPVLQIQD